MMYKTHAAFGFLIALILAPFFKAGNIYLWFLFVLLGSLLPDIDEPKSKLGRKLGFLSQLFNLLAGHRGIFHSIFFAILLPGVVWYFLSESYGLALFIGYLSHLLIDGFTESGINFLHPFAKLHLSGFIRTGTMAETIFFLAIIGLILVKVWLN